MQNSFLFYNFITYLSLLFLSFTHSDLLVKHFSGNDPPQAKCDGCSPHENVQMIENIVMTKAPNLLVIHLKRFDSYLTKNVSPVLCDPELQFTLKSGQSVSYKHISTISHLGTTTTSGHYITHKRMRDGRCFTLNDTVVTSIEPGATFDSHCTCWRWCP